jgi:hypothetical protein
MLCLSQPQTGSVLCRGGSGTFDAEFRTGVAVHVGAARENGAATLATRACEAKLSWEKQELIVGTGASQIDLDAFGVDFGNGEPSAAFQIKKSDSDCCAEYRIYSLTKPPRLLRTITGGESFRAADTDLDGRVEIWARDGAVDGFEGLTLSELDSVPTAVFRFARGGLLASSEFPAYFDDQIRAARSGIDQQDLQAFRNSDGRLAEALTPASAERLHRMRVVKTKVLEIVWAYLYSGREPDAWRSLAAMWPPSDVDRIRAAILKTQALGIVSQAHRSAADLRPGKRKQARIYDARSPSGPGRNLEVIPPKSILLEFPPEPDASAQGGAQKLLDLVIDAAGKVRSAEGAGASKQITQAQIAAAATWKFIPAFKDGHAVASRTRISVSPKQ